MPDGWIKFYRKFQEWEWYSKSEMVHLFLHLLLNANPEDMEWQGRTIKKGQVITGRRKISEVTGISEQTIRTCLQRLVETGEILVESTNKFSIITICNYGNYQDSESESNQQVTSNQPTENDTLATAKPKKSKADVEAATNKRMADFYNSLIPYVQKYGKQMVREFYNYWSETNKSCSKMRWEQEKTWVLEKRLDYWSNRTKNFNGNGTGRINTSEQRNADAASNIAAFITGSDD